MRTVVMPRALATSLALATLIAAAPAYAKCKYNVDTVHSITGEKVIWTKWSPFTSIYVGDVIVGSGISIGDQKYFALRTTRPVSGTKEDRDKALVIPADGKLLILLDDKSVLELHSPEEVIGDVDGDTSEAVLKYPIDTDGLDALLTKRIMNIRISTTGKDMDYTFGKKGSKKMQNTFECII